MVLGHPPCFHGGQIEQITLAMALLTFIAMLNIPIAKHDAANLPLVLAAIIMLVAAAVSFLTVVIHMMNEKRRELEYMQCELERERELEPQHEVIYVQASPSPTLRRSTPRSKESPFEVITRRHARRGGGRRLQMHARKMTRIGNPRLANDCGYVCCLWLMKMRPSKKRVRWLRARTADEFEKTYNAGGKVMGVDLRRMLDTQRIGLKQYLNQIRTNQWASKIELAIALCVSQAEAYIDDGASVIKVGKRPTCAIVLRKGHYTLRRCHRAPCIGASHGPMCVPRGGMHKSWKWEDDNTKKTWEASGPAQDDNKKEEQEATMKHDWAMTVKDANEHGICDPTVLDAILLPSVRTDIAYVKLVVRRPFTVRMMRSRIAEITNYAVERLRLTYTENIDEVIMDDDEVPGAVYVHDEWTTGKPEYHYVDVAAGATGASFVYRINKRSTHDDVVAGVAAVMGVQPHDIKLTDVRGLPWEYPGGCKTTTMIVAVPLPRGGMEQQRGRSLSPTAPYMPEALDVAEDVDIADTQQHESVPLLPEDPPVGDEALGHYRAVPATGYIPDIEGDTGDEDEDDYPDNQRATPTRMYERPRSRSRSRASNGSRDSRVLWANVFPRTPPPAQPDRIPRPARDRDGFVGFIRAHPDTPIDQILAELSLTIQPHSPILAVPDEATTWAEVVLIRLPAMQDPGPDYDLDLRINRWELYQRIRRVYVLEGGEPDQLVIMPWEIHIWEAQRRLDTYAARGELWVIVAVTPRDWVIVKHNLPEYVVEDLEELEMMRALPRGGMEQAKVEIVYANNPTLPVSVVMVEEGKTVKEYLEKVAEAYHIPPQSLLIMSGTHILALDEMMMTYKEKKCNLYLTGLLGNEMFEFPMSHQHIRSALVWQWMSQKDPPRQYHEDLPIPRGEPTELFPRGGGRDPKRVMHDPRTAMHYWAMDKIQKDCPGCATRTFSTLLRAEAKTMGSIMNSRSPAQTKQILTAALKRAGLERYAEDLLPGSQPAGDVDTRQHTEPLVDSVKQAQEDMKCQLADLVRAMTTQTSLTGDIAHVLSQKTTVQDIVNVVTLLQQHTASQMEAYQSVAKAVVTLESKIDCVVRAVIPPPPMDAETVVGDQDLETDDDGMQTPPRRTDPDAPTPPLESQPSIPQQVRDDQEVIEVDGEQEGQEDMEMELETLPVTSERRLIASTILNRLENRAQRARDPNRPALQPFRS